MRDFSPGEANEEKRARILVRGIYGGMPSHILERGQTLEDYGVNAIWIGSGGIDKEVTAQAKALGVHLFAEFNTMHDAAYLQEHPDAAPIGIDGQVCPPPNGWQGLCPTHPRYRKYRMDAFRTVLQDHEIDGIWLDYHHSHASWEQAVPEMPETCFCDRCLAQFQRDTGVRVDEKAPAGRAAYILGEHHGEWVRWRCDVFTDWVRQFRQILDTTRPGALLGTFHCPWSDAHRGGARLNKLNIDLKSQARYIDVFSIMPYHARFGHPKDPAWISRQVAWLGQYLGIEGEEGDRHRIWPIVQLSDWGETVPVEQVQEVLDHGTRLPASGVMVFAWSRLHESWDKVEEMGRYYRAIRP